VLACSLLLSVPALPTAAAAPVVDRPRPGAGQGGPAEPGTVEGTDGVPQTSDGVVGRTAPPDRSSRATGSTERAAWQVAPGVRARVWDEQTPRGPVRLQLVSLDWRTPGVTLDQADAGTVASVDTVRDTIKQDRAVAGVNGDFFDIGDTDAPLGVARDVQDGLRHGRIAGWNSGFFVGGAGRPRIGPLPTRIRVEERPGLAITNLNSAAVIPNGVGVYTPDWGRDVGARVTDGPQAKVRTVVVRDGKVVRNTPRLSATPVREGLVLVGRGEGARSLVPLRSGAPVTVRSQLDVAARTAITGNAFLLRDGKQTVVDDREMHPRTAVGIDRDRHRVLLLVVDGRQSFSRGYTMVELARKMRSLGAEDALNLDGGGSSTMLARRDGVVRTVNSPSDGFERRVANALEVRYHRPRG